MNVTSSSSEEEDHVQRDNKVDERKTIRTVYHVEQKYDWDCGVSAVAMCLNPVKRQQLISNLPYFCSNEKTGFGTSTWTIDLCYLLAYFDIKHIMYTTTVGVNPDLGQESFYSSILDRDTRRVSEMFKKSEEYGIKVVEQCLSLKDITHLLKEEGPLILLVNANLLHCKDCSWNFNPPCSPWCQVSYLGHYILAVGFNLNDRIIYYRNPGLSDRICRISFADFDLARSSFGTDNDVIVIQDTVCTLNCIDKTNLKWVLEPIY